MFGHRMMNSTATFRSLHEWELLVHLLEIGREISHERARLELGE